PVVSTTADRPEVNTPPIRVKPPYDVAPALRWATQTALSVPTTNRSALPSGGPAADAAPAARRPLPHGVVAADGVGLLAGRAGSAGRCEPGRVGPEVAALRAPAGRRPAPEPEVGAG